jgi:hypothetical protein
MGSDRKMDSKTDSKPETVGPGLEPDLPLNSATSRHHKHITTQINISQRKRLRDRAGRGTLDATRRFVVGTLHRSVIGTRRSVSSNPAASTKFLFEISPLRLADWDVCVSIKRCKSEEGSISAEPQRAH